MGSYSSSSTWGGLLNYQYPDVWSHYADDDPDGQDGSGEPVSIPSSTVWYSKRRERSYGWITPVIEEIPECYLTFSFLESIRLTAVEMESVTEVIKELAPIDQDLHDSYSDSTSCSLIQENLETNTISEKRFFIGNFTVQASDDEETWTTLFTGSNVDNTEKFVFLTNTAFFRYYRIVIANNDSLDQGTFDSSYYGIRNLRFYAYQYAGEAGSENIALYEFDDLDNPKIVKVSNSMVLPGEEEVTVASDEEIEIEGDANHLTFSGTEGYYSGYVVSLASVVDPGDALTLSICVASTISGVGTDDAAQMYFKEDKVVQTGSATAELFGVDDPNTSEILFTATASFDTPVDTVHWTGHSHTVYDTVASGVVVSGTRIYPSTGTTRRTYTTYLRPRAGSYRLYIDEITTESGTILDNAELFMWGYSNTVRPLDMDTSNSIVFEVTTGEAYNCRLTAWDDVTHSTLENELIYGNHARVSAVVFCGSASKVNPGESKDPINLIRPPVHNLIFKGNTVYQGQKLYYGDFDMVYRYQDDVFGDYLMFKPMLYGVHPGISYGVHDFMVTLHYSYT